MEVESNRMEDKLIWYVSHIPYTSNVQLRRYLYALSLKLVVAKSCNNLHIHQIYSVIAPSITSYNSTIGI
jgi:hypothetical protein